MNFTQGAFAPLRADPKRQWKKTVNPRLIERPMKEERKKEIDLKWSQLIAEIDKPKKTQAQTQTKKSLSSPKVIRRRKGNPDMHIT